MILGIRARFARVNFMSVNIGFEPAVAAFGAGTAMPALRKVGRVRESRYESSHLTSAAPLVFFAATAWAETVFAWSHVSRLVI